MQDNNITTKCGFIAVIGKPNVGKSTLINNLIGEKVSITANKPQTTRHKLLGIKTEENNQYIFIDTPGVHFYNKKIINKLMNKEAKSALEDVDLILFIVDVTGYNNEDKKVLEIINNLSCPIILLLNKIDKISKKDKLLPLIQKISVSHDFSSIIPISAFYGEQIDNIFLEIDKLLPYNPFYFDKDDKTDRNIEYRICEIIREKLTRKLEKELPYAVTVSLEKIEKTDKIYIIHAIIWVERFGQKSIIIGKKGENLKEIGIYSREDMEKILDSKVHLSLWVKVKEGWTDNAHALNTIGFFES